MDELALKNHKPLLEIAGVFVLPSSTPAPALRPPGHATGAPGPRFSLPSRAKQRRQQAT